MNDNQTGRSVRLRCCARRAAAAAALVLLVGMAPGRAAADSVTPAAFHPPLKADRILVLKAARKLELLRHGVVLKSFPIALGAHPVGPKHANGDGRTPEGSYYIDGRLAQSRYHLALHISYPNAADRAQAAAYNRDPGGDVMIHGLPAGYRGPKDPVRFYKDWTKGCISVGDTAIEQIWAAVDIGTPIEIRP